MLGVSIFIPKRKRGIRECAVDSELLKRLWNPIRMEQYAAFKCSHFTTVNKSYIEYFKNGAYLGKGFTNLHLGKYHPAISLYNGASATVNFGPELMYPPLDTAKPFALVRDLDSWEESVEKHRAALEKGKGRR